tara:strand:- start:3436 stop:4077 length:642 start_codon:yes stop_codon:yes gene_type:complete
MHKDTVPAAVIASVRHHAPIKGGTVHSTSSKGTASAIRRPALFACLLGIAAMSLPLFAHADESAGTPAPDGAAGAAFERLKALEGTWRVADNAEHPLRVRFYPTARGSTLVESWDVNGTSHSLTIYHRDGDTLLATHYCPQGNQPRMALAKGKDGNIGFTFRDVTDLDAKDEQHQHDLSFELAGTGKLIRSETYRDGDGKMHPSQLVLERAAE